MRRVLIIMMVGLTGLTGCALLPATHVINGETPYFNDGPNQCERDGLFQAGEQVRVISEDGSYSRIWTRGGLRTYVWNGSLTTREEWDKINNE